LVSFLGIVRRRSARAPSKEKEIMNIEP